MTVITRRRFLELGAARGAALFVPWADVARAASPVGVTPILAKFVEP